MSQDAIAVILIVLLLGIFITVAVIYLYAERQERMRYGVVVVRPDKPVQLQSYRCPDLDTAWQRAIRLQDIYWSQGQLDVRALAIKDGSIEKALAERASRLTRDA